MKPLSIEMPSTPYTSSNLRKHTSGNPLQRWLLKRFHDTAADLIDRTRPRSVLDAGCGEGFAMRYLLHSPDAAVVGMDGSLGALQVASSINPERGFAVGDLLELPFPSRSFDLVICMEVLEHLEQPDRGLAELCRVSHRWLLLSVPDEPFFRGANFLRGKNVRAWGNDPGHINHWSSRAFLTFVSAHCRIESCRRSFPWTLVLGQVA
jgi:SAM-dependent methyltransferase